MSHLSQQFFLAEVVDGEGLPRADQEAPLELTQPERYVLHLMWMGVGGWWLLVKMRWVLVSVGDDGLGGWLLVMRWVLVSVGDRGG